MKVGNIYNYSDLPVGAVFMIDYKDTIHIKCSSWDAIGDDTMPVNITDARIYNYIHRHYADKCMYFGTIDDIFSEFPYKFEDFR